MGTSNHPYPNLRFRRMGSGAILFNERSWSTHILNPAALIVFESLLEHSRGSALAARDARKILRHELDLDPDSAEIGNLLTTLERLGIIA